MVEKGPSFDRFLIRLKDFIIIATAIAALGNWIYRRSEDQSLKLNSLDTRISNIERIVYRTK